ncbi:protein kinase [Streptomyces sp. AM 2-1-1]|uniref:protein kinase n=1 Tax=Streptomyces sp. AM 2-1-1 TaxID=3028709 RepID=UPI0023BA11EA|nr:protein kinase [Streptomyces sp. AM 2-1-1]WEH40110.1 protein kinase [Streptomyces sp. AM 2-1-1]
MDDYAGRVLADRYRLPLPPSDAYELVETRAFDTYSGQEVLVRQVPLPEVVDAEVLDGDGHPSPVRRASGRAVRRSSDPAVRRAIEAAQTAAQVPDHPRLDQVFDVFAEAGSLWIVSELVPARPLAALLAERPLNPYRAAEIGSDVLTALRVLHAHGWTHRNITVRTVLVCDDGRVMLTGLAAGAAEEALCGYVTVPRPDQDDPGIPLQRHEGDDGFGDTSGEPFDDGGEGTGDGGDEDDDGRDPDGPGHGDRGGRATAPPAPLPPALPAAEDAGYGGGYLPAALPPARPAGPDPYAPEHEARDPYAQGAPARPAGYEPEAFPRPEGGGQELVPRPAAPAVPRHLPPESAAPAGAALPPAEPGAGSSAQLRAARAGAIAAYRAGTRAATARVTEEQLRAEERRRAEEEQRLAEEERAAEEEQRAAEEPEPHVPPRPAAGALPPLPSGWGRSSADLYPDRYDDEDDEDDDDPQDPGPAAPGRRVHLAGSWEDGHSGRPVSAGGSGADALRADAHRESSPAARTRADVERVPAGGWDSVVASGDQGPVYRGPATPLAAERARQARIAVVGAVTERWAPEQAGPVHENWQLAPPIGPATDLWALGALLYRAVQGHAPYPEENAAELVQMVCGEPPAFAEECGALRPVVESLLRQDPAERPDFEELRGWLRSLVRSAPEPEAGADVVPLPAADAGKLPIVRRKGELVRRRRGRFRSASQGRHRQGRQGGPGLQEEGGLESLGLRAHPEPDERAYREPPRPQAYHQPPEPQERRPPREPREPKVLRDKGGRPPRRLGRLLLLLILLALAGAVVYAVAFLPKNEDATRTGAAPTPAATGSAAPSGSAPPAEKPSPSASDAASSAPGTQDPQTSRSAVALPPGYTLRKDPEGFEVGVLKDWQRSPANADRQVRYGSDGFSLLIVPGRDTVRANGADPLAYQRDREAELQPFRDSSWSTATGLRRVDVGRQAMAEGQYTWQDVNGREVYVRNLAMVVDGRYHIIQVIGPVNERDQVTSIYQQVISSYKVTS